MIHISKLSNITERKDPSNNLVPFSFKAVSLDGSLIEGVNCVCTSSNFSNRTRNIKFLDSKEFRKIRNISFIEINNVEVIL